MNSAPSRLPLLDVQHLCIRFGAKPVVQGISFALAPGEKLALVGESGSGKTLTALSLLRLLDGAALQGRALFAGRDGQARDLLALPESWCAKARARRCGSAMPVFASSSRAGSASAP